MMELYVQSRGYDQNKDYRWLKISQDGSSELQLPPLSKKAITLIQSDSPSVVLECLPEDRLLLLITGIEPEGRFDFLDRQIRIDVAWVGDNTEENEPGLRRVAARALRKTEWNALTKEVSQAVTLLKNPQFLKVAPEYLKELEQALQQSSFTNQQGLAENTGLARETISKLFNGEAILYREFMNICSSLGYDLEKIQAIHQLPSEIAGQEGDEYGFQVLFPDMLRLASVKPEDCPFSEDEEPDITKKIGKNVLKLREELAEELQKCYLPKEQDTLVVVTGFKKRETLEEAGVWRSLSKLVDTEDWEKITRKSDRLGKIVDFKSIIGLPMEMGNGLMSLIKKIWA